MKTLATIPVRNGRLTELYTIERDDVGEIFILCALDTTGNGPIDTMHIDAQALRPIALALLEASRSVDPCATPPVVVRFPYVERAVRP